MRLALCQMSNAGSVRLNLEKSLRSMKEAAENHADMVLFPEVQLTEFFPQFMGQDKTGYQVSLHSDIVEKFQEACRKYNIMAVPNLFLKPEDGGDGKKAFDASLIIDRDGTKLVYADMDLPRARDVREKKPYTSLRRTEFYL